MFDGVFGVHHFCRGLLPLVLTFIHSALLYQAKVDYNKILSVEQKNSHNRTRLYVFLHFIGNPIVTLWHKIIKKLTLGLQWWGIRIQGKEHTTSQELLALNSYFG